MNLSSHGVRSVLIDGTLWYAAKDIANLLGIKNTTQATRNLPNPDWKSSVLFPTRRGLQRLGVVNEQGAAHIIKVSRRPEAVELAYNLGLQSERSYIPETETIRAIQTALKPHQSRVQYQCGPYRVDLYFPGSRVVVECDERHHMKPDAREKDQERQAFIEKELGCNFVRYSPDEDIFQVISRVLTELLRSR